MVKYRLIIEYHKKGNNNTQVATLCGCSRMTVWKVVERLNMVKIKTEELLNLSDDEINYILSKSTGGASIFLMTCWEK